MARTDPELRVRIPEALYTEVQSAAQGNGRSLTAEVIARLNLRDTAIQFVDASDNLTKIHEDTIRLQKSMIRVLGRKLLALVSAVKSGAQLQDDVLGGIAEEAEMILNAVARAEHETK